jgi:Tfp pilus assembly protein PilN
MNFRQDEFAVRLDFGRFGRDFLVTSALAVCALILGTASFATSTLMDSRRADQLEAEIARLYSEAVPGGGASAPPVKALREAVDSANRRAEFLGVYRGNLSALDLLTEISKLVPDSLNIVLEELSIDRQTLRMRVRSESFEAADRLGARLASFAPFTDNRIGAIETDKKTGAKRFSVTISIGGEPTGR